MIFCAI